MEQKSYNTLPFKHISQATDEIIDYIVKRKDHEIDSLKTRWTKFNNLCMGGIEPNAIYTISGISGSGKSSFVNTLESDIIDLNRDRELVVLSNSYRDWEVVKLVVSLVISLNKLHLRYIVQLKVSMTTFFQN